LQNNKSKNMSNTTLEKRVKRRTQVAPSTPKRRSSWPLYSGKIPTVEEAAESVKSLTSADIDRILINAGIIDEEGNLTEIYI